MKLDYDFLREILLFIEEITDGQRNFTFEYITSQLNCGDKMKLRYHLKYLNDAKFTDGGNGYILDITPTGRNYLNSIRNDSIWNRTKEITQKLGSSVTLSTISSVADSLVRKSLGL